MSRLNKASITLGIFGGCLLSIFGNFLATSFYDLFAKTYAIKFLIFLDSVLFILIMIVWFYNWVKK